jgi:hypothetical protein
VSKLEFLLCRLEAVRIGNSELRTSNGAKDIAMQIPPTGVDKSPTAEEKWDRLSLPPTEELGANLQNSFESGLAAGGGHSRGRNET